MLDKQRDWRKVIPFLCAVTYLYLTLFVPLFTPIDTSWGDDSQFLNEATRILKGQVIYRDFFEFNFAGTQYFYALLIGLFGARTWIPNACLLGLGLGFFWTSIVIAKQLMTGALKYLPGLLFLSVAFRSYLDATHHWYSVLLIMIATAVMATKRSAAALAVVGGLCGLALCFSQNHGALAVIGFAIFILWEGRADRLSGKRIAQRELCLWTPFAAVFAIYVIYFASTAGFENLFFCTVTFVFKYYGRSPYNGWASFAAIDVARQVLLRDFSGITHSLFIALLIPGVYFASIIYYLYLRRSRQAFSGQLRLLVLLNVVGLSLFISVINSASVPRLGVVSLPGFVLLVWLGHRSGRAQAFQTAFWAMVSVLVLRDIALAQTSWLVRFDTPSGPIALIYPAEASWYRWLGKHTRPGDYVFDTHSTGIYFRFRLRNPTALPYIWNCDITRPEQVRQVVEDLERHKVGLVVWDSSLDAESCSPSADHLSELREYLSKNYIRGSDFRMLDFWTVTMLERIKTGREERSASFFNVTYGQFQRRM